MTDQTMRGRAMAEGMSCAGPAIKAERDIGRRRAMLLLAVILVGAAGLRVGFAHGSAASDDTIYLLAAQKLAVGEPPGFVDNRVARASWLIVLTLWLKLFGPKVAALCYLDVLVGVGCVGAIYWLGAKIAGRRAALWAALLYAGFPLELIYNGIIFPDRMGLLLMLVATGLFVNGLEGVGRSRWLWAGAAGGVLAVGISAKESAGVLPIVLALYGMYRARPRLTGLLLAGVMTAVAAGVFSGEYVFHAWWTGDALYRHHAAEYSFGPGGIHFQSSQTSRALFYPAVLLARTDLTGLFGWLLLSGLVFAVTVRSGLMLTVLWAVGLYGLLCLGSTSLQSFRPLPYDARFVPAMVAVLFVAAGALWQRLWESGAGIRWPLATLLVGFVVSGVVTANGRTRPLYWGDFPLAVRAAVQLERRGECPGLLLPEAVYEKLALDEQLEVASVDRINLRQPNKPLAALLWPAWYRALVVPSSLPDLWRFAMSRQQRDVPDLAGYLESHARAVALLGPARPLDRLLGALHLPRLTDRPVVGHVYVLGRR